MSLTKFAKAEILDIYGSNHKVRTASLAKSSEFNEFDTQSGFMYVRIRAISSRVNKNYDAWPSKEIAGDHELIDKLGKVATRQASLGKEIKGFRVSSARDNKQHFIVEAKKNSKYGFSTFLGKPIFVDHNNSNPRRARGVIVDSRLHVEPYTDDPYYKTADCHESFKPATWVELLLEIDAKTFPKLAKALLDGSKDPNSGIDGFSMGANVERSTCSHCGNVATNPDEFCNHIKAKGSHWDYIDPKTGSKTSKRSFEFCGGVQYFELSSVFDPADETALTREVIASIYKEAEETLPDGPADMYYQWKTPTGQIVCPECGGQDPFCPTCKGKGAIFTPDGIHGDDGVRGVQQISPDDVNRQIDPSILGPVHQGSVKTSEGVDDINHELYVAPSAVAGSPARPMPWTEDPQKREEIIQHAIAKARKVEGGMQQLHKFLKSAGIDPITLTAVFYDQNGQPAPDPIRNENGELSDEAIQAFQRAPNGGGYDAPPEIPIGHPDPEQINQHDMSLPPDLAVDENGLPIGSRPPVRPTPPGGIYDQEIHGGPSAIPNQAVMNDPRWSSTHTADNTPQVDLLKAPKPIDTLSSPIVCSVCGEQVEGEECPVCGWQRPPDGFDDPDLQEAHDNVQHRLEGESPQPEDPGIPQENSELLDKNLPPQAPPPTKHYNPTAHVSSGMQRWRIVESGVINNNDKLLKPGNKPATNEPPEKVLSDQLAPVTSSVHTAADFLAVAGHINNTGDKMEITADATAQAPDAAKPKTQVDVVGVGGVDEASNEEASKPSVGEVDVLGIGGVDSDVAADEHETLPDSSGTNDAGFNTDKTTDGSGPTKTWSGDYGDSLGQHSPVTSDPFPEHSQGVTGAQRQAYNDAPYPANDGGLAGGTAQKGNEPIDPYFKADERVDLFEHTTSPANNSGPTKTWSGTDGNGVNRQQEPVTHDSYPANDGFGKGSAHLFNAFKLADTEVEIGIITSDQKYARVAELESQDPRDVLASLKYVESKIKTANLGKRVVEAKRIPSLQGPRTASVVEASLEPSIDGENDWAAFL